MAKAPNTMVIVRKIFIDPLRKFKKATKAKPIRSALVKEDEEHEQHWRCAYASSMAEVFKPPSAGRS